MTAENGFTETFDRWGRREFRQEKAFGNWHVVFQNDAENGIGHWDKYNAQGSLGDKFNHLSLWVGENLGTNETVGKAVIVGASAATAGYAAYRILKWIRR